MARGYFKENETNSIKTALLGNNLLYSGMTTTSSDISDCECDWRVRAYKAFPYLTPETIESICRSMLVIIPQPNKIIHNGPATIVFWDDGMKTVIKCSEADTYDPYTAYCVALAKRLYGNNSRIKKVIRDAVTIKVDNKVEE